MGLPKGAKGSGFCCFGIKQPLFKQPTHPRWRNSYTLEAIDTLVELMRGGKDERVRVTASQALLDRGWGKAKVEVVTGAEGSYLDVLRAVNESMLSKRNETQI